MIIIIIVGICIKPGPEALRA